MKRFLLYLFIFMGVLGIDAKARGFEHNLIFDDLTTANFKEKLENINFDKITKICSYEFCDYLKGKTIEESLDMFTKKYINEINNEEIKNTLNIKGIKITKITVDD